MQSVAHRDHQFVAVVGIGIAGPGRHDRAAIAWSVAQLALGAAALVVVDVDTNQMTVDSTFFGLTGTTTASHIHCCTATPGTGISGEPTKGSTARATNSSVR